MKRRIRTGRAVLFSCFVAFGLAGDAASIPERRDEPGAHMNFCELAREALVLRTRIVKERLLQEAAIEQRPDLPPQWDIPFPQEVQDAVSLIFPTSEYSPHEEGYDEFCERMPESNHIVYIDNEKLHVSPVVRRVGDDVARKCSPKYFLKIEQVWDEDGSIGYAVTSEFVDDNNEPLLEVYVTVDALPEALVAFDDWLSDYMQLHEFDYDAIDGEETKARLVEKHLMMYDALLNAKRWQPYLQLQEEMRDKLQRESQDVQEMILHVEEEE